MPRKYDRVIRYYASWFDDLLDPAKEFTTDEICTVLLAIKDAQIQGSLDPLNALPISIRRALSMATLGEQIIRLLEKTERMRARGSAGGRAAASAARSAAALPSEKMREEMRTAKREEQERKREEERLSSCSEDDYLRILLSAAHGDERALKALGITQDVAVQACERRRLL